MALEELKHNLKQMIIDECEKEDVTADDISDDVELFSPQSGLELDSLDALTISMALQNNYNLRVADPKEFRRIVTTINSLSEYVQKAKNG